MARSGYRISLRFFAFLGLLALIPLYGVWTLYRPGPLAQEASVLVRRGMTVDQLAEALERQGIIRNAAAFRFWARARRLRLIRGEYALRAGASMADVAGKLKRGDIHTTKVVITPSLHAWAVQKRLETFIPAGTFWDLWRNRHLAAEAGFPEAPSLEGLIAPATYSLHRALEPEEILLQMVEAFRRQVRPRLEGGVLPPYETLVLASLAEKETSLAEELPRVTGVYHNRLRKGMRLQCDPTSLYARWMAGDLRFTGPTREDTQRDHPYNTYAVAGLPPGPIAIPGREAIEAAKAPEATRDLYFVATGQGGHRFGQTLDEHNRNVSAYRRELKRRKRP